MKKIMKSLSIAALAASLTACSTGSSSSGGTYKAGTYTGTANGFGGTVTVTITTDANSITDVKVEGPDETPTVGGAALDTLAQQIKDGQTSEIDGVSGATVTSTGVKEAAAQAIQQAQGKETSAADVKMKPGTYTASAWGFSQNRQVPVSVTVDDKSITDITVDTEKAKETGWYLQSAIDNMIPRMLDNQSVAVDSITGATTSSNAIKTAVKDCLSQALEAGGSDASAINAFETAPEKEGGEETIDVDVVVVGMGGTGSAAALRTAELQKAAGKDVSVLGLEKAGTYGGTSCSTTSLLAFNSKKTIEQFGEDNATDDQQVIDFLKKQGILGVNNKYAEWYWDDIFSTSGKLVDWLIDHGFYFGEPRKGFWGDFKTQYYYNDSEGEANLDAIHGFFDTMIDDYKDLGGQLMTETEGYELIYDKDTNTVTGVKARNLVTGKEYTINAKSVIMATGGFGGNPEMMKEYNGGDYWLWGDAQNDGKLVEDAIDNLDAGTLGMNVSLWGGVHNISSKPQLKTFDIHFAEDGTVDEWRNDLAAWSLNDVPNMICAAPDAIWVTTDGVRKVNEDMMWGWPIDGAQYYSIVDQNWVDNLAKNGFSENRTQLFCNAGYNTFPLNKGIDTLEDGKTMQDVLDACEKEGILVKADTVEELAQKLNIDADTLKKTIDDYNAGCKSGTDSLGKAADYLTAMENGPYYAFTAAPRPYSSVGGLDVNDKLQVIQSDGTTAINGLYAGGTDSLGATAPAFGGELQVWAYMSGYLAAQNAQDYINQ